MKEFRTYFYNSLINTNFAYEKTTEKDIHRSILVFIISIFVVGIATLIARKPTSMHPLGLVLFSLGFLSFSVISIIERLALMNLTTLFGIEYNKKKSVKTLFADMLSVNIIFVYALPISLIVSAIFGGYDYFLVILTIITIYVFYLYHMFKIINKNFKVSGIHSILILLVPAFFNLVISILALTLHPYFYYNIFLMVISGFMR